MTMHNPGPVPPPDRILGQVPNPGRDPEPDQPIDPTPDRPTDPDPDRPIDPEPSRPIDPNPGRPNEPLKLPGDPSGLGKKEPEVPAGADKRR